VLEILSHDRRRILHLNVTEHSTTVWTARQLLQSCGLDDQPRYLIRDRDAIFGEAIQRQVRALQIEDVPTAPKSPWQNPYAEHLSLCKDSPEEATRALGQVAFGAARRKRPPRKPTAPRSKDQNEPIAPPPPPLEAAALDGGGTAGGGGVVETVQLSIALLLERFGSCATTVATASVE